MTLPDGADIELVQRYKGEAPAVFVPNALFINGQEVLIPGGAPIDLALVSDESPATVTITMYVRNFAMRAEQTYDLVTPDDMRDFRKRTA